MLPIRFPGRSFQLWRYSVSHRELLLRSNRDGIHASRCEVLFTNVARLDLPTTITDLEVCCADADTMPSNARQLGSVEGSERHVFLIHGRNCTGYVVASAIAHVEDAGSYDDPSSLMDLRSGF